MLTIVWIRIKLSESTGFDVVMTVIDSVSKITHFIMKSILIISYLASRMRRRYMFFDR